MLDSVADVYALVCRDFLNCLDDNDDGYFSQLDQLCFYVHGAYARHNFFSEDALALLTLYRDLLDLLHTELTLFLEKNGTLMSTG